jgi:4-diphosphocytidyl-2-C-methyl-D-erythritol kinase
MKLKAYAKVNMGLRIVGKNAQDYHDLESIFIPIKLHDDLIVHPFPVMRFVVHPNYRIAPEKNTVLKMVEVLREHFKFTENFSITLYKHIPSQAGLGGGSADAAAILNYLNGYFGWNLSVNEKIDLAKKVGADVPFCVFNTPAFVSGIGDKLEFFGFASNAHLILVQAKKGVSTKLAFSNLNYDTLDAKDIRAIKQAFIDNKMEDLKRYIVNDLEKVAIELVPEIQELKDELSELGCSVVSMSGSGSVVVGLSEDPTVIDACYEHFKGKVRFLKKTQFYLD